jgi:class 3 adenylate cyclase
MESQGTPGRIQITRETYELIADDFECEPRGTIAVKGKGEMDVWYVLGRRSRLGERRESELERPAEAVT